MPCDHCGALRAVQGGLMLGGTIQADNVVVCACPDVPRIIEDGPQVFGPLETFIITPTWARWEGLFRFCTQDAGLVRPKIANVECLNYPAIDLSLSAGLNVFGGDPSNCPNYFSGVNLGSYSWFSDSDPLWTCFAASPSAGGWTAIEFGANVFTSDVFGDPPIIEVTFDFDRSGC